MTDITLRGDLPATFLNAFERLIAEGRAYHAYVYDETQTTNNTIMMVFKTPSDNHIIAKLLWASKTGAHVTINEGVTYTRTFEGSQTMVNIICSRREAPQTSGILNDGAQTDYNAGSGIRTTAQSLVNTTEIFRDYLFGADNKYSKEEYVIFKKSTKYSIVMTADAPGNKSLMRLEWIEKKLDD